MLSRFKHLEFKRAVSARLGEQLLASEPLPPGGDLFKHFGFTVDNVVKTVKETL